MRFFKLRAVGHGDAASSFRIASVPHAPGRSDWAAVLLVFVAAVFVFAGIVVATAMTCGSFGARVRPRSDRIATTLSREGFSA
jgi:hypothetical protein